MYLATSADEGAEVQTAKNKKLGSGLYFLNLQVIWNVFHWCSRGTYFPDGNVIYSAPPYIQAYQ